MTATPGKAVVTMPCIRVERPVGTGSEGEPQTPEPQKRTQTLNMYPMGEACNVAHSGL